MPSQSEEDDVSGLHKRRKAGEWLKHMREYRRMSQRDLANALGLEYYSFISQIESGKSRPPPDKLVPWADALGVPHESFAKGFLYYYEPQVYRMLFGESDNHQEVIPRAPATPPPLLYPDDSASMVEAQLTSRSSEIETIKARLGRLEALLLLKGAERL